MYCHNCGTQIAEGSKFCNKCGANLEGTITQSTCSNNLDKSLFDNQDSIQASSKQNAIMQFIRGIPFILCLLVFSLEAISYYSQLRGSSVYGILQESLQLLSSNQLTTDNISILHSLALLTTILLSLTILAAAFSYISGIYGAFFGIFALIDFSYLFYYVASNITTEACLQIGFYSSILLFISGIIMCFASPHNEKETPNTLIASISIISVVVFITAIALQIHSYKYENKVSQSSKPASNTTIQHKGSSNNYTENSKEAINELKTVLKTYAVLQAAYTAEMGELGSFKDIGFTYNQHSLFNYEQSNKEKNFVVSPKKNIGTCSKGKKIIVRPYHKNDNIYFNYSIDNGCEIFTTVIKSSSNL